MTTVSNDNTDWFFNVDDWFDIVPCNRFKVKAVCGVKVGGNGFRVVVDNDYFVAKFFERPYGVYAGVVKFNPLTDTDRTGTKYDNTFFGGFCDWFKGLVFCAFFRCFEYGVEVRGCCGKFTGTGINHFVDWCEGGWAGIAV